MCGSPWPAHACPPPGVFPSCHFCHTGYKIQFPVLGSTALADFVLKHTLSICCLNKIMLPAASLIKTSLHTEASTCPCLARLSFGAAQRHPTVLEDIFLHFFFWRAFFWLLLLPSPWLPVSCELLAPRIWASPSLAPSARGVSRWFPTKSQLGGTLCIAPATRKSSGDHI